MAATASKSAVARVVADAWRGAARGWRASPDGAPRAFALRLAVATLLATLASIGSAVALRAVAAARDGRLPGDATVDGWVEGLMSVHTALWLGALTSSAMVVPVVVLSAVLWARMGAWDKSVLALAAFLASKVIILAGWITWSRPRPGGVAGGEIVPAEMSSYPSGHSVQALTIYGLLALWWAASTDRWWERALAWTAVLIGAVVVGIARVRIGAHYPSDIAGGIALGALWLAGAAWSERTIPRTRQPPRA